jgi:two-component system KDP operon response regulator KdpE
VENTPQVKVLIVDDAIAFRRALRLSLTALGFHVEEASTGEEALALLQSAATMRCFSISKCLAWVESKPVKRSRFSPRPAVLILTVRDGKEDRAQALESGADDFVTKPFALRDLVRRIRAALGHDSDPTERQGK